MYLQVKSITPILSKDKINEKANIVRWKGNAPLHSSWGHQAHGWWTFHSFWNISNHIESDNISYQKIQNSKKRKNIKKKGINYRLTKSARYLGFVLMLQHLHFFPLASSSSGWFIWRFLPESLLHHIGFLCLFLLMKLWHQQQIFYKSSESNRKQGPWSKVWFLFESVSMLTIKISQQGRAIRMSITQPSGIPFQLNLCKKKSAISRSIG